MYNPYEEFEKTNTPISDQIQQKLQAEAAQSEQTVQTMQEAAKMRSATPTAQPQAQTQPPAQPQPQPTSAPAKAKEKPKTAPDAAQTFAEGTLAIPTGATDFAVDTINLIPGVHIPKIPKFRNEIAQAARDISSFIVPTLLLHKGLGAAGKAANAKIGWQLGKSELVKFIGEKGVAAGAGVAVDAINTQNETGDNLQGTLKKTFPKTFNWISNDWATLDSDSPDVKRAKNINEGVGLGVFTDLLEGSAKFIQAVKGTENVVRWLPENEQAKTFFSRVKQAKNGTVEGTVKSAADLREVAKDELGTYRMAKNPNLDKPMFGIHDAFDVEESGIRSVDNMGVIGASVDAERIAKNDGTIHGRLGSIISEAALKFGLDATNLSKRLIIQTVVDNIKGAGKYSYLRDGRKISFDEIDKAGSDLAQVMLDPRMDSGMLKGTLDNFMNEVDGMKNLNDVGYNGAFKAIKGYMDEYLNMDTLKAQAYVTTSLAGQVSDMAEGARYMEGTAAVERAQEQILDRMEYLMVEKGLASYVRGSGLNNINLWKKMRYANDPKKMAEVAENARAQTEDALANIIPRAKNTASSLREISKERPEFLKPLQMAWEFSDGNIDTMGKLNNFVEQSLSDVKKAFVDGQPEIPNVIVQGYWSNIYNSVLTSISTPLKAGFGNAVMLLEKPISVIGGAAIGGDIKTLKRGWYQYSAFADTMKKGLDHMSMVYRKAASDPSSVNYIMRDDIVRKNEETMDILHSFARSAEQRGELGPLSLYYKAEALNDLSNNPMLRFGANAMTALDGFAKAVIANGEARGRAFDKFIDGGVELNAASLKAANEEIYKSMFDSTGMIKDEAVDYASREISMNLDNPAASALSGVISKFPVLKPFFMFPRTSMNIIAMTDKHSPVSLFAQEYNKIAFKPLSAFSQDEIVDILTAKGLPVDENIAQTFHTLRAEIRGRKAIGTITIGAAVGMFLNDNLRGNGHFDKERQKVRQELGWKPRSYRGTDGKWYTYDGLGPISDFLALTADVMDNFDSVSPDDLENTLRKIGFMLGANLTNKSMLAGIEPMNDVLSGNPAALNRWAASFGSSLAPLSGARNELGRLMAPQLRELDMEFTQLLRNRNKYLDAIDPKGALPDAHDWIDGKKIGYSENFFTRAWNATMPMKVSDALSPERQFLLDIEYDSRPSFMKNQKGIEYTPQERSELYSIMGKQGYFKSEIQRIMKSTNAQQWRDSIKAARGSGSQVDPRNWQNLYRDLDVNLDRAKRLAEVQLSNRDDVMRRQYQQGVDAEMQKRGVASLPILENK
jgi:hypothetical protein